MRIIRLQKRLFGLIVSILAVQPCCFLFQGPSLGSAAHELQRNAEHLTQAFSRQPECGGRVAINPISGLI